MLLLWTDITYLFPEEPMELYGHVRIEHIPHALFNQELRKCLADKCVLWKGSMSHHIFKQPMGDHVIAHMSIGCLRSSDFWTPLEIEAHVNAHMARFRLFDRYQPKVLSTSEREKNIWFTIIFQDYKVICHSTP